VSYAENVKTLLFPFTVKTLSSANNLDYLSKDIPSILMTEIKNAGGTSEYYESSTILENSKDFFKISENNKSDAFITGTLEEKADSLFVLNIKLGFVKTGKSLNFEEKFRGFENLFGAVKTITAKIGAKLFKKVKIVDVEIRGNSRIESEAIKRVIKTKKGFAYAEQDLSDDLKAIYKMGYFGDIRVSRENVAEGVKIVFTVKEKPTIREIYIRGNSVYEDPKIKENLSLKSGSILNIFAVDKDIEAIKELYKDKNYHQVKVKYEINERSHNRADLLFIISEGEKTYIDKIIFNGNKAYDNKTLLKQMESSEKGFFSWLTSSGEYKKNQIDQDRGRLLGFYYTTGYANARIAEPEIVFKKNRVTVTFRIHEGKKFHFGKIKVSGDMIVPEKDIINKLKSKKGEIYNRQFIQGDVMGISDLYANSGYANALVIPNVVESKDGKSLDIDFKVTKNKLVYINNIIITGNEKTRDKVIRREFPITEQSLFSKARIQKGIWNLRRMDYFQDVRMETIPTDKPDKVDVKIDVEEKTTGMFTFGAGYSSQDSLFSSISVTQRNFMGRGQTLKVKGEFSNTSTKYTLSFVEPWLFDIPLSAGFDIYNWDRDYDEYTKKSRGGAVKFGYPVFNYTKLYWSYSYERSTIDEIASDAADEIKALEGENITSSTNVSLVYDSRNRMFNPTEGTKSSVSIENSGGFLGGDIAFTKYTGESGRYFPLFWNCVFFIHGKAGFINQNSKGLLPDYEKFYLGGMNSVRGYKWRGIYSLDSNGDKIGGDKFIQGNAEFIFPVVKKAGLMGLFFYDAGDVFDVDESISTKDIKRSWGYGIRWYSPVGPIRLEYGRMLDPEEGESETGRWEFTMGQAF